MPPTMTTRSAGRPATALRGGGTGGRASRGGGRTRGRSGDQDDGRIDGQSGQVGVRVVRRSVQAAGSLVIIFEEDLKIMPPRMTIRSAGRATTAPQGEMTGGWIGRGGGRTGGRSGDQGDGRNDGQGGQVGGQGSEVNGGVDGVPDFSTIIAHQLQNLRPTIVAQVGDQGRGQGNGRNQNDDAANDNTQGNVSRGCTYKEFLACNPKESDGKGGTIVYTCWIKKMKSVQYMSGCRDSQKVKYTAGLFVGMSWEDFKTLNREEFHLSNEMQKLETELWNHVLVGAGHAAYTDRFYELARLVPHLVSLEATEPKTIQKVVQIAGKLTDEALRNGSIKKNHEKRGNGGEPSKDRNGREDNKRTRTGNAFATTTNPIGRENIVSSLKASVITRRMLPNTSFRWITCGYPWPELEGKIFGMIQERYGSSA
ncbi:hypothetical protein Tco_1483565 [Tanacetum coccineum]